VAAAAREKPGNRVNYTFHSHAGVAELADAQDLKSCDAKASCGFDPRPRHKFPREVGDIVGRRNDHRPPVCATDPVFDPYG
jgi:hypothetical protein